jgi:hypothetical protein
MTDPIREALAQAIEIAEGLAEQQSRRDEWYVEPLNKLRVALANPVAQPLTTARAIAAPVAQPDCRTCQNVSIRSGGCSSVFLCVDASMYKPSPLVRYWKTKE